MQNGLEKKDTKKGQHITAGLNYARATWFLFCSAFYSHWFSGDKEVLSFRAQLKPVTVSGKAMKTPLITYMTTFILTLLTFINSSCNPVQDKRVIAKSTENKMNDIERLLDSTFPFVEDLLTKQKEFFPLASAVKTNDSIAQVGTYDGDDKPLSDKLMADLKAAFIAKKEEYKTVAIFYDVIVVDPDTKIKTDAIAVFIESKNEKQGYTFYYPYSWTKVHKLIFSDPWKSEKEKEIFIE